jgi:hypothetical protein
VPPDVHYPDLVTPAGWPYFRQGLQIRVVPPERTLETAEATIVVSPLVPRLPSMPSPRELVEAALLEEARQRFEVEGRAGPEPARSDAGLEGISLEVSGHVRPAGPPERRIYVMYADALCFYAVSYLAWAATYATHLDAFRATARSVRPFRGRHLPPTGPSPDALIYRD